MTGKFSKLVAPTPVQKPENQQAGKPENLNSGRLAATVDEITIQNASVENRESGKPENLKTGKEEKMETGKPVYKKYCTQLQPEMVEQIQILAIKLKCKDYQVVEQAMKLLLEKYTI